MIEIRSLNPAQLEAFVQTPEFAAMPHLPISRHRGLSHAHNPRARAEDALLLLACTGDGQMLGYLGLLPDTLHFADGTTGRAAWLSCMWVDPDARGQGISTKLVSRAYELWGGCIMVTEFTPPARRVYDKLGYFFEVKVSIGRRLYQRLDLHNILPAKGGKWLKMKGLLRAVDLLGNAVPDLRFLFPARPPKPWRLEWVDEVDEEIADFIAARQAGELFRRGKEELNWMVREPWMREGEEDAMSRKYEFSSVARLFRNELLKVRDEGGELRMFFFFCRRDRNLKLNYCYFDPGMEGEALGILRYFMHKWRINTLLIYHPELVAALENRRMGVLFRKEARREYRLGKRFEERVRGQEIRIMDGDGDCGFT